MIRHPKRPFCHVVSTRSLGLEPLELVSVTAGPGHTPMAVSGKYTIVRKTPAWYYALCICLIASNKLCRLDHTRGPSRSAPPPLKPATAIQPQISWC